MAAKDYIDPKGYWGDPSGNIRRMSGEQEIIATVTDECSNAEWKALYKVLSSISTTAGDKPNANRD